MKRPRLYLETSVWNFLFADDAVEKKLATEQFFREVAQDRFEIYISETVNEEISFASPEKRGALFREIERYNPVLLEQDEDVLRLSEMYVDNGVLTRKHYNDLLHLAYASVYGMNALVSWNMSHLVKMRTQDLGNSTNIANGYAPIQIRTPQEVTEVEQD